MPGVSLGLLVATILLGAVVNPDCVFSFDDAGT
jgi:hypothetical protein